MIKTLNFKKAVGTPKTIVELPPPPRRSILDRLLASRFAEDFMPELHMFDLGDDGVYRKMSFCGPFTKIRDRVVIRNGRAYGFKTPPINQLDAACANHDLSYEFNDDPSAWIDADLALHREAIRIRDSTTGIQRNTARTVAAIMKKKGRLHITRNVL